MSKNALVIFARPPLLGQVKTRLAKDIGEEDALSIYSSLLNNILEESKVFSGDSFVATSTDASGYFKEYNTFPQKGEDLGERMFNALNRLFDKSYEKVIIVGSDIPNLGANIMEEAVAKLDENDVVIGPSSDGGYYLIGISKMGFAFDIFKGIVWSSNSVLNNTLANIKELTLRYKLLRERRDIDTLEDLLLFLNNNGEEDSYESGSVKKLGVRKKG